MGPLYKGIHALESVQKFACKVCLKRWDMDYESILQQLELTSLSQRRKFLKLTTMYNIINDFPIGYFVQNYFPYSSNHGILQCIRPFARTNYLHSSFVPSIISLWNNLPESAEDEITVGHRTFSEHLWHLSEQKSICSAKLSERRMRTRVRTRMHNRSAKPGCEVSTWLYC